MKTHLYSPPSRSSFRAARTAGCHPPLWRRYLSTGLLALLGSFGAGAAHAVTFSPAPLVVNTNSDHDNGGNDACTQADCTLREAIRVANLDSGSDTISFDGTAFAAPGPHTIQLESALPDLNSNIAITGPGPAY